MLLRKPARKEWQFQVSSPYLKINGNQWQSMAINGNHQVSSPYLTEEMGAHGRSREIGH